MHGRASHSRGNMDRTIVRCLLGRHGQALESASPGKAFRKETHGDARHLPCMIALRAFMTRLRQGNQRRRHPTVTTSAPGTTHNRLVAPSATEQGTGHRISIFRRRTQRCETGATLCVPGNADDCFQGYVHTRLWHLRGVAVGVGQLVSTLCSWARCFLHASALRMGPACSQYGLTPGTVRALAVLR